MYDDDIKSPAVPAILTIISSDAFQPFIQVYLSVIGLGSLYMGIGCAYSLTASMGFPFSPLHSFIPFLLVGLGTEEDVSVNS